MASSVLHDMSKWTGLKGVGARMISVSNAVWDNIKKTPAGCENINACLILTNQISSYSDCRQLASVCIAARQYKYIRKAS